MVSKKELAVIGLVGFGGFAALRLSSGDSGGGGGEGSGQEQSQGTAGNLAETVGSITRRREGDPLAGSQENTLPQDRSGAKPPSFLQTEFFIPSGSKNEGEQSQSESGTNGSQSSGTTGSQSSGGFEKSGRGDPLAGVAETEEFINEFGSVTRKRRGDPLSGSAPDPEPDPPDVGSVTRSRPGDPLSGTEEDGPDPEPNVDEEDVGLKVPGTDDRVFSVTRRRSGDPLSGG